MLAHIMREPARPHPLSVGLEAATVPATADAAGRVAVVHHPELDPGLVEILNHCGLMARFPGADQVERVRKSRGAVGDRGGVTPQYIPVADQFLRSISWVRASHSVGSLLRLGSLGRDSAHMQGSDEDDFYSLSICVGHGSLLRRNRAITSACSRSLVNHQRQHRSSRGVSTLMFFVAQESSSSSEPSQDSRAGQ